MKVYELAGIKNIGKKTQIDLIVKSANSKKSLYVPPPLVTHSKLFPKWLILRKKWYLNADPEEIITANLTAAFNRQKNIQKKDADIVLLNKGYMSIKSACMAAKMRKDGTSIEAAEKLVDDIADTIGYRKHEDLSVILRIDYSPVKVAEERNKKAFTTEVKHFLQNQVEALDYLVAKEDKIIKMNGANAIEDIHDVIVSLAHYK